jgi:RimJ/RimL family protein N-acetyltransferase
MTTTRTVMLTSVRLRLRLLDDDDVPFLRLLNDNPNVHRFTGDGIVPDDAAALAILRTRIYPQVAQHGVGRWAVERTVDDVVLGWCGLRWDEEHAHFDLGYRFFEEHWGRGYTTEAAAACLAWGRARFPSARIVGRVRVENHASVRVLEKLGLHVIGHDDDVDGRVAVYA